jgi:hypothetical protein
MVRVLLALQLLMVGLTGAGRYLPDGAGFFQLNLAVESQPGDTEIDVCKNPGENMDLVAFPWLAAPQSAGDLNTREPFTLLAGRLIANGIVDASYCDDGGLMVNGNASSCGMDAARYEVNAWQNRFDSDIYRYSGEAGVPARLLKGLIAQESQFWPGYIDETESGMGQLTLLGADTALMWNSDLFTSVCNQAFGNGRCTGMARYSLLSEYDQSLLKGSLYALMDAGCPDCEGGVDIDKAGVSVGLTASVMVAYCRQTAQIIYNISERSSGSTVAYPDIWLMTLFAYNAGSSCMAEAYENTYQVSGVDRVTWDEMDDRVSKDCRSGANYVGDVLYHAGRQMGD